MQTYVRSCELPVSPERAFAWHEAQGAFERLQPPWEKVRLVEGPSAGIRDGSRVVIEARVGPLRQRWEIHHREYRPGELFTDELERGPFASWRHRHLFKEGRDGAVLEDRIHWSLPLERVSEPLLRWWINRKLERMFRWRHAVTRRDLAIAPPAQPQRILIAGGTGLVGRALVPLLRTRGHEVRVLTRNPQGRDSYFGWNPAGGEVDRAALEGVDTVINLAGETISQRWSEAARRRILGSRVEATATLVKALRERACGGTLVNVSGIGYYGVVDRGLLGEDAAAGEGFLAEVCQAWEDAAREGESVLDRVVIPRLPAVLTPQGGALAKMLPAFRLGLGGPVGSGRQPFSWIGIEDLAHALRHLVEEPGIEGAVNLVHPEVPTSREFARGLGKAVRRPAFAPLPGFMVRLLFGSMGRELLLGGVRPDPGKLLDSGFRFGDESLDAGLRSVLGAIHSCTQERFGNSFGKDDAGNSL